MFIIIDVDVVVVAAAVTGPTPVRLYVNRFNPLKPNDLKNRRTAQLTSRCCILYIYSTNIRTEYFKNTV